MKTVMLILAIFFVVILLLFDFQVKHGYMGDKCEWCGENVKYRDLQIRYYGKNHLYLCIECSTFKNPNYMRGFRYAPQNQEE